MPTDDLQPALWRQMAWVGSIVVLVQLFAGYLFLSFYRVMDGGLKETRRHLRAMTDGDLTTSPSPWGNDEAAQLMLELRNMQDSLRSMVTRVRRSSDEIVHSSSEIASGAMDLSARTEQAAANLEESAASMEEITSTVQQNADNAKQANMLVMEARKQAEKSGSVVASTDQLSTSIAAPGIERSNKAA